MPIETRSTKAGARTPATRRGSARRSPACGTLNEGRGANPGDTVWRACPRRSGRSLNEGRGANPGDTRGGGWIPGGTLPRSTKAGARTPATPACSRRSGATQSPLNEGRGANPGDTRVRRPRQARVLVRSTKAGARTPATPRLATARAPPPPRSTKAGARTPATHARGGDHPPALPRSTKAGARTPATPPGAERHRLTGRRAQRRPGREPRRHTAMSCG